MLGARISTCVQFSSVLFHQSLNSHPHRSETFETVTFTAKTSALYTVTLLGFTFTVVSTATAGTIIAEKRLAIKAMHMSNSALTDLILLFSMAGPPSRS